MSVQFEITKRSLGRGGEKEAKKKDRYKIDKINEERKRESANRRYKIGVYYTKIDEKKLDILKMFYSIIMIRDLHFFF